MNELEHERLDVYRITIEYLRCVGYCRATPVIPCRPAATASSSISFNIAEGAGEFAPSDQARFYRTARRSATACAAILDAYRLLAPSDDDAARSRARELLLRIVAMLTAMVLRVSGSLRRA
jgi:four helix bundle protein